MGRFTKFVIAPIAGLFLLSSCQNTANYEISTKYNPAPYKRIIQFSSNHKALQQVVERKALTNENFILKHEDDFSEFRIVLNTKIERINSLETRPLLMGRLQKSTTPVNFKVGYKLTNTSRHVLAKGEFAEVADTMVSVYPKLNISSNIDSNTLDKIAKKIIKDINAHIQATSWSTTVIGQKDNMHVTVFANESAGLKPGAVFITETQPTAKLQVAMFEKTATSQSRAVLSLMEGFLPTVGRRLVPAK